MPDLAPLVKGEIAARAAMASLGRPGAIDWFLHNAPRCVHECTEDSPYEWWVGFDRELSSVAGTA
jgi:hypothetical protein